MDIVFFAHSNEFYCLLPGDQMGLLYDKATTRGIIAGLTAYVENYPDDLIEANHKDFYERHSPDPDSYVVQPPPPKEEKKGFVYLIKSMEGYKIGRSVNLEARLSQIKSHAPSSELIHTIEAEDVIEAESILHKLYDHKRISGEWFDLCEKQVNAFKTIVAYIYGGFEDKEAMEFYRQLDAGEIPYED